MIIFVKGIINMEACGNQKSLNQTKRIDMFQIVYNNTYITQYIFNPAFKFLF